MATHEERHDLLTQQRELLKAYARCFDTEDGRLVLKDLRVSAFLTPERTLTPNGTGEGPLDTERLVMRCGAQVFFLSMLANIEAGKVAGIEPAQSHAITGAIHGG